MVSVIIPSFNHGNYLSEALDSVIAQTYENWECIIVDDGSGDNTKEIAQSYVNNDERIIYLWKKNGGLSSARNAGLEKAKGDWIQFLDADDILEPGKLQQQLAVIGKHAGTKNIVSYTDYCYGTNKDIREKIPKDLDNVFRTNHFLYELIANWETKLSIPPNCFLFSSDFFIINSIRFDETLANHEDFECWLRIFLLDPVIIYENEMLCRYRRSDNSMSSNMRSMGDGFLQAINKHLNCRTYPAAMRSLLKRKRLEVLQGYRRYKLMTLREKLISWEILLTYYSRRAVQKLI